MPEVETRRDQLTVDIASLVSRHGVKQMDFIEGVVEEVMIRSAIAEAETYNAAAAQLGIGKSTMYRKMKAYGIPKRRAG